MTSLQKLGVLLASVFLTLSLSNCVGSGAPAKFDGQSRLANLPMDVKICIMKVVPEPQNIKTKADIVKVITDLKRSEAAKSACGQRLISLYEAQKDYL